MLRTALRPKWLGLLGVVVLIVIAFVQLGRWQLGVAQGEAMREAIERARSTPAVDLTSVLSPGVPFRSDLSSRPVTATGRYAAQGQFLVPARRLGEASGYWLVTPFVVEATGVSLPVLRGFTTDPQTLASTPPEGRRTIRGGLAPGESPVRDPQPLPSGQLGSIDTAVLVNTWPGGVYNAFVFLEGEDPEPTADARLARVPTPVGDTGIQVRNAAYALQWWVFAAFAVWMWWRMVRDDARTGDNGERDPADDPTPD